ncbi:MAG: translation elongation factor Ts [Candidatus Riflebacteria bacterium]|nr:translation elongation factor Ts [Candidatus Riflebacteria bacterium]
MQITAKTIKELRDRTGAGMVNCKEALNECGGDIEKAVDYLREKGLAATNKRSGRTTAQGIVLPVMTADRKNAAIIEVNCETDFVAKTEDFKNFVAHLADLALNDPSVKNMTDLETKSYDGHTVAEHAKMLIAKTGENITLNRVERFKVPAGVNATFEVYSHGDGAIGVIVQGQASKPETWKNEAAIDILHETALQVAGMTPLYVSAENIPAEAVEREKAVISGQMKNEEAEKKAADPDYKVRPDSVLAKIAEGKLNKFFADITLLKQEYFKENKTTMEAYIKNASKPLNDLVVINSFTRWALGEESAKDASAEAACSAGA